MNSAWMHRRTALLVVLGMSLIGGSVGSQSPSERLVSVQDACDPTTFNAVVGPGTCVRPGGVQFDPFIAELERKGEAGAWHFAPPTTTAPLGQTLVAINRGGEVHTFTHVEAFGGGIVPLLNDLAHVPTPAPECLHLEDDDFVALGTTYEEDIEDAGVQRFQCCIHPWMRLEVRVPNR
jgi:plastocyanin